MKYVFVGCVAVMSVLSVVAWVWRPRGGDDGRIELVWVSDDNPVRREQIELFNELYPQYRLRLDPQNAGMEKVIVQCLAGVGPQLGIGRPDRVPHRCRTALGEIGAKAELQPALDAGRPQARRSHESPIVLRSQDLHGRGDQRERQPATSMIGVHREPGGHPPRPRYPDPTNRGMEGRSRRCGALGRSLLGPPAMPRGDRAHLALLVCVQEEAPLGPERADPSELLRVRRVGEGRLRLGGLLERQPHLVVTIAEEPKPEAGGHLVHRESVHVGSDHPQRSVRRRAHSHADPSGGSAPPRAGTAEAASCWRSIVRLRILR